MPNHTTPLLEFFLNRYGIEPGRRYNQVRQEAWILPEKAQIQRSNLHVQKVEILTQVVPPTPGAVFGYFTTPIPISTRGATSVGPTIFQNGFLWFVSNHYDQFGSLPFFF